MAAKIDTCLRFKQNSDFRCTPCNTKYHSKDELLKHLNYYQSAKSEHKDAKHGCYPCSINFDTVDQLIEHLENDDIHVSSLHNYACQGMSSLLRKYLSDKKELDKRCRSHFSKFSLQHMGYSPLHCATMNGFHLCVIKLLKWGANANLQDEMGCSSLHHAMLKGDIKIIMTLLRHGGNLFLMNKNNATPFDTASMSTKYEILLKLFYFEEQNGSYLPIHVRNPDIAYRVVDEYNKFFYTQHSSISLEDGRECSQSSKVTGSPLAYDKEQLAKVFELFINHQATKDVYYDVINHCKERVRHSKLLVLGHVAAGKSSLVRTLSGKEFCQDRHITDGIESSFLETVSMDDSWQEIQDKEWTYHSVVAKQFVARMHLTKVVQLLSNQILPDLAEDFSRRLSIADSSNNDDTGPNMNLPISMADAQIDEPVKALIRERLECRENFRDDQFKVTVLDFAGHTLYLPMHHIFLNSKAMYLICFDLQEHEKDATGNLKQLLFWLNSVVAHKGCEPAVILVGTHADCVQEEVIKKADKDIREGLYERFMDCFIFNGNSIFFAIENSKGPHDFRAKLLKQTIQCEAQVLSSENDDEVPIKWLRCEKYIHEQVCQDKSIFSLTKKELRDRFESFCEKFDNEEFQNMLELFHDGGVIWLPELLVNNVQLTGKFSDFVILNVQHLMDAMTTVCQLAIQDSSKAPRIQRRTAKILQESAKISHENLVKVLAGPSARVDEIIQLLIIFNILYPAERVNNSEKANSMVPCQTSTPKSKAPIDDTAKEYIIPSLLAEENLDHRWNEYRDPRQEDIFYIDFYRFACEALFHQLLVQLAEHSILTESIDPVIRKWDGIFGWYDTKCYRLEYDKHFCTVKGSISNLPNASQRSSNEVLKHLKGIVDEICSNFFRFQRFRFMIPCPNRECSTTSNSDDSQNLGLASDAHFLQYDPNNPKKQFCGRNRIDFSNWGCSSQPRTDSLRSDSTDGSLYELHQSTSVDSGVSEPTSAAQSIVNEKILTFVSDKIGSHWPDLARHLSWSDGTCIASCIEIVKADHPNNQKDQAFWLLTNWQRDRGCNATLDVLQKALADLKREDLVENLNGFMF